MPIYAPEDPTPGVDARRRVRHAEQRRDDHLRRRRRPGRRRRHGHLEPGVRQRASTVGIVDYPSDDPRTPIVNDPTRDVVGNAAAAVRGRSGQRCPVDLGSPGIVDPGDTLRYTITCYNTGAIPATGVVLTDDVPREHDLRGELDAAERPAGRAAGRRLFAARRRHLHQLVRSHAAAAGRGRRARSRRTRPRSSVRSARERRYAGGHAHPQPGGRAQRGAAEPADRRRRQSVDRAGADRRRRRQRPAAVDHEAGRRRRRRRRPSRARRSSTSCASPTSRACRRSMS